MHLQVPTIRKIVWSTDEHIVYKFVVKEIAGTYIGLYILYSLLEESYYYNIVYNLSNIIYSIIT